MALVVTVELARLFAPHVAVLIAIVAVALLLLTRWSDTADRSAYAVGAFAAVVAPVWVLIVLAVALVNDPLFWFVESAEPDMVSWLLSWAFAAIAAVAVAMLLFFTWRPLWITGLFLKAPQGAVRRRFKAIETSLQFALGALIALGAVRLVADLL